MIEPGAGLRISGRGVRAMRDDLAVEAPFELRINGRSQVLLMVSPQGLEDLARGHCLSEGLTSRPEEVLGVTLGRAELPGLGPAYWADVELPRELARRARSRRVAPAATSCGLCGLESFQDLGREIRPVSSALTVDLSVVQGLFQLMERGQEVFPRTGAAHAAALGTPRDGLVSLAEDVGRHNALDKALGAALAAGQDLGGCLAAVSGRISFEMALKAARSGLPLIASVSAATTLGRSLCADLGVTLVAFARQERATVYCHPHRVLLDGVPLSARP
ncbi:MAG: formate dehydrogenase accessory sulfurtransferase FdhD [Desulfarculus sp.]|nr:MAG: formate dehydrogenase accessory sulfurtransferase FdhD [Desulfarculus sp.]